MRVWHRDYGCGPVCPSCAQACAWLACLYWRVGRPARRALDGARSRQRLQRLDAGGRVQHFCSRGGDWGCRARDSGVVQLSGRGEHSARRILCAGFICDRRNGNSRGGQRAGYCVYRARNELDFHLHSGWLSAAGDQVERSVVEIFRAGIVRYGVFSVRHCHGVWRDGNHAY